jgi:hypothetical protein
MLKSEDIIKRWPIYCDQQCTLWIICVSSGVHLALKMQHRTLTTWMAVSFLYFLVSFLHRAQLWAEGLDMPCSALNLGCGITINSEWLTDTAKWEDILKLYEIDKQNVLYHLLPDVMHRHLNAGWQSMMKASLAVQVMSSYQHSGHSR